MSRLTRLTSRGLLLLSVCFLPACGCEKRSDPEPQVPNSGGTTELNPEDAWLQQHDLAWERSAYFARLDEWPQARESLAGILADSRALPEDWVRAATIELQAGLPGKAEEFLNKAKELAGEDSLGARYVRGRLATQDFDSWEKARDIFEDLLKDAPQCLATHYALGRVYEEMDPEEDAVWEANQLRAQGLYTKVLDAGLANGGAWYVSALYRLFVLSLDSSDETARATYEQAWKDMETIGAKAVRAAELNEGLLARIAPPKPRGNANQKVAGTPGYELRTSLPMTDGPARGLLALDMDGDRIQDLVYMDDKGLMLRRQMPDGEFESRRLFEGSLDAFLVADLSRDGHLDVLMAQGPDLLVVDMDPPAEVGGPSVWSPTTMRNNLPTVPAEMQWFDFDHDGDLDVLCVGEFGLRVLRNDGVGRIPERPADQARGGFADVTETLGVTFPQPLTWCAIEDFDADQDVDFLVGGPKGAVLASSLRNGKFEDLAKSYFSGDTAGMPRPQLRDLDGDGLVDFVHRDPTGLRIQYQDTERPAQQLLGNPQGEARLADLDMDGQTDVIWPQDEQLAAGFLALGQSTRRKIDLAKGSLQGETQGLVLAEMDAPTPAVLAWEILRLTADTIEIWHNPSPGGNGLRLTYQGKKDNQDAIGALVETRSNGLYQRVYHRGGEILIGTGLAPGVDVLRVTWANGVSRSELDIPGGDPMAENPDLGIQTEGLIGSCPFLYTWDGNRYVFISDVLGITPLGLPMAPGMLVPPDHDEYVLVSGSQMKPKDGFYEMQFTEELREVTYLDRAQLLVVDHPTGTEFFPNERFCFPPFPAPKPHLFSEALVPTKVTGSDGLDWTSELTAIDGVHADPAKPLGGQFLGLSEPHWLELSFDASQTQGAERLRLVATGWFYWTDASVNMATARTPDLDFTPPMILVPSQGPDGEIWTPIGPPVGFPAGKTKTMVIDLAGLIDASDPRFRIQTSLTLYWDSLRLAVGDRDGEQRVTYLEPSSADLWQRGFSAPVQNLDATQPERFEFEALASTPRWDQHPGMYTKFGSCLPLLNAIDDRYVIMGSGDALTLRFDAKTVPPLAAGMQRSFLVFLDGWAKDRDPNTLEALEVEPLPFHGMLSYPYGSDQAFPSGPAHQAWRKEWNTRPGRRLVSPLASGVLDPWMRRGPWPTIKPIRGQ